MKTKKSTQGAKAGSKNDPTKKKKVTPKTKAKSKAKSTKKKLEKTHILAIIDKSGSMNRFKKDAIGGFNSFLDAQKAMKEPATMNVVLFSNYDQIHDLHEGETLVDVKNIDELNDTTFVPNGSTALNDAIVQSMANLKTKINGLKPSKRPDKILVLIVTDGDENDSREFPEEKTDDVKNLIELRKKENWQFIFMCSTENTVLTAKSLGVSSGNVLRFSDDSVGNESAYFAAANAATMYRSTSLKSKGFADLSNNLLAEDDVTEVKSNTGDENFA